jgi:hypothetical protein
MNPEDTFDTSSCCSCCCEPAVDATPAIEEPITPDPAPVIEEPAPVVEAPAPVIDEPVAAVEAPAPPEPNFDVAQNAPAPEPSPAPAAQTLEPNTAIIGGPEPDEFAELRQNLASNTVVGGPVPNEFTDLGQTLASSTVVGGPVPNEFANLGLPQSGSPLEQDRGWVGPGDDLLLPNPNRTFDPNAALFASQAARQWGDAMGQLQAAALNSAGFGPTNHTAQYSRSLGIDWVQNGRDHV